jgi:hypothetical protein
VNEGTGTFLVLFLWLLSLLALLWQAWRGRKPVAGLTLAYWLQLFMIHGLSGLLHTWGSPEAQDREAALAGFEKTGYALAGLLAGNLLAAYLASGGNQHSSPAAPALLRPPAILYILIGLGLYLFAGRVLPRIPGTDAVVSSGFALAVAGFGLAWLWHWRAGRRSRAWLVLASTLLVPVLTVSLAGFLGFGVSFLVSLGSFVAVYYRPRWHLAILGPVVAFVGVSLFPAYMMTRTDIRKAVWGGAAYGERFEKMYLMLTQFQTFDPDNKDHMQAIDGRLNQNILVGRAVRYLEAGRAEYAQGETLWNALVALIPRALWPDKPTYAGSGGLVTRFTGVKFERYTSVGIGQVMELYVNFGTAGVVAGYVILGLLLGLLDRRAGAMLAAGDWKQFTLWFMVGMAFLQVGGNFAEATASAAGSLVLWVLVHAFLGAPRQESAVRGQESGIGSQQFA